MRCSGSRLSPSDRSWIGSGINGVCGLVAKDAQSRRGLWNQSAVVPSAGPLRTHCGLTADYCEPLLVRSPQLVSQSAVSQQSAMPLVRSPQQNGAPVHKPAYTLSFEATAI